MRFEEIISEVPVCGTLAEVGCDHARLTELALRRGLCRSAVVSDISAACLEKARRTLSGYDCVRYIVCDGVPEGVEPDCLLVCGMAGTTCAIYFRATAAVPRSCCRRSRTPSSCARRCPAWDTR